MIGFKTCLASAAAACLLASSSVLALEAVTVKPLAEKTETASGQPIALPRKDVRVLVSTYDIAPGARLPVHKHPFARYAVVQGGTLEVTNTATGASTTYRTGDVVIEMIDQWHHARNIGEDAVKLLVIDQIEGAGGNTVLHRD